MESTVSVTAAAPGSCGPACGRARGCPTLRSKTEAALAHAGLEPETRKFHPHVTLARLDGAKAGRLAAYLETHGSFLTEEFPVGEFALYSSHLGRKRRLPRPGSRLPLDVRLIGHSSRSSASMSASDNPKWWPISWTSTLRTIAARDSPVSHQ